MELMALTPLLADHAHEGHGWWPLWPLLWLAVLATVVWIVARRRRNGDRRGGGADRAREILAERFARREIAGEEYRERLEQLR